MFAGQIPTFYRCATPSTTGRRTTVDYTRHRDMYTTAKPSIRNSLHCVGLSVAAETLVILRVAIISLEWMKLASSNFVQVC